MEENQWVEKSQWVEEFSGPSVLCEGDVSEATTHRLPFRHTPRGGLGPMAALDCQLDRLLFTIEVDSPTGAFASRVEWIVAWRISMGRVFGPIANRTIIVPLGWEESRGGTSMERGLSEYAF